jgi:FkbM family methyltransferase
MKTQNFFLKKLASILLTEKNYHKIKSNKIILDIWRKKDYDEINSLISKIVPNEGSIIDIGANMGQFSGRMSLALPKSSIYSVEPILENCIALRNMISKLKINNITVFNLGISDSDGTGIFTIPIINGVVTSTQATLEDLLNKKNKGVELRQEKVKLIQLDNFIVNNNITNIKLIKIDTEGHDYKVINSGQTEILKNKPIIKLECSWNSKVINWLYINGYEPYKIQENKLYHAKSNTNLSGDSILVHKDNLKKISNFIHS